MLSINCIRCAFGPGSIASRGLLFGAETASRNPASERDELSQRGRTRKLRPGFDAQNGTHFPLEPLAESVSRNSAPEWDALSGWSFKRKVHPGIRAWNGMHFPEQPSTGNCVPEFRFRVGRRFRLNPLAESSSQNWRSEWDTVSGWSLSGNCIPV